MREDWHIQRRAVLYRHVLLTAAVLLIVPLAAAQTHEAPSAERPNVVLVMADDLGREALESYGGRSYTTPHLNRLAASGMRFERAYSTPLCTPSRVRIMTGLYTFRNYVRFGLLDPDQTTFANLLQDAGYATAVAGKWQLRGGEEAPHRFGFDEYLLWQLHPGNYWYRYKNPIVIRNGSAPDTLHGRYGPDVFTEFINDFIERHQNRPFLVYYPMVLPHDPFQPTPTSEAFDDYDIVGTSDTTYFGDMVAHMDRMVGRIERQLENLGLRDNTLLLFTTDNGTHHSIYSQMGRRVVQGDKGYTTEAGTHVPLIASWPGVIEAGTTNGDLVDFTDFLPTLAAAAGIDTATFTTDGVSFYPTLTEGKPHPRKWIYQDYPGKDGYTSPPRRYAQNKRYKLYSDGRFYDLVRDPEEHVNLDKRPLSDPARSARAELQNVLNAME